MSSENTTLSGHNGSNGKKEILKEIIRDLHRGEDMDVLKKRFADLVKEVSPSEIAELEQKLIEEGMPESEVKRLCDVHVEVFKVSLEGQSAPVVPSGHPIHTFMLENRASESIMDDISTLVDKIGNTSDARISADDHQTLIDLLNNISDVDIHYLRKENQLFPLLEAHNVSGPSQVMWALHDDIRALIKKAKEEVSQEKISDAIPTIRELIQIIRDMIFKDEHILYPMSLETLSESEWRKVKEGEEEIGYAWISGVENWPDQTVVIAQAEENSSGDMLSLNVGRLSSEQINLLLNHLPFDITFVDENDQVAYYSRGEERIFPRSPAIIGRNVQKCHPSKSVHIVERIVDEFKSGARDTADFRINIKDRLIYIRYFAVRDADGVYKGVLEVSQDVTDIRKLEGEKRLLDWK